MYIVLAVLGAVGLLALVYYLFAPGPVRARAYARAQKQLQAGDWKGALAVVEPMLAATMSETWRTRLRHLAGECHQRGLEEAVKAGEYETGRDHALQVAKLLEQDEGEQVNRVVEAALAEVRRQFADGTAVVTAMIERTERLAGRSVPEARFWRALVHVREGDLETALTLLTAVSEETARQVIDPPLYVGILLHRLGRPQEALKWLSEANRIDGNCPLVTWQIGVTLMVSGGDSGVAMRALQRAMGPRGLPQWQKEPGKLWIEGLPEGRSYIRRLALKNGNVKNVTFPCPLLGSDLHVLVRQGNLALAQAFYKQERFAESADLYGKLLESSPPTVGLLRGYGLSLARSGAHDAAYKQLRLALDQEEPKDPFTAGYLALCGALGKPKNEADKPRNIEWALKLLARFPVLENAEWAGLVRDVHAEARKAGMTLDVHDQELLCDALASVQATDPKAAAAFAHLAMTHAGAIKPIYAWLYTRAATAHGVSSPVDLDLFARTFQDIARAKTFFEQQKWDIGETEYTYLERSAKRAPGRFPDVLGPDYPPRGEAFLLARSETEEQAGKQGPARSAMEVLLRLSPTSVKAHDRLACLHYRGGELDRAIDLLGGWSNLAPGDHWPLVRQAVIEQERGNSPRRGELVEQAMSLTRGPLRGAVAYLGAQLSLRDGCKLMQTGNKDRPHLPDVTNEAHEALQGTKRLLEECLREDPRHADALWCLAALHTVLRDRQGLADQAELMNRPDVADPRFQFLAAVCHLEAGKLPETIEMGKRAAAERSLQNESRYVMAWAQYRSGDADGAIAQLSPAAADGASPSVMYARALLGQLLYQKGQYDEAIQQWSGVAPACRARWGLDEPLRHMVLLAGLQSMQDQRYEQAADRFREAGRLGLRDRRIGGLITLALVKAGQRLLYEKAGG